MSGEIRWIQLGSHARKPHADVATLGKQPVTRDEDCDDFGIGVTAYERGEAVVVKLNPTSAVPHRERMVLEVGRQIQQLHPVNEEGVTEEV